MALRIRLKRVGSKRQPCYKVVVMDARKPRDGKAIEEVGGYQPTSQSPTQFFCSKERVNYWIERGAQVSDTVHALLKRYNN